jgi:hypothetical protein
MKKQDSNTTHRQVEESPRCVGDQPTRLKTKREHVVALLAAIAVIWGVTASCGLSDGLKGRQVATATVQVNLTQSMEQVQGTLSALATQTAQAMPPSPTSEPPSPTPTPTPTATNTPTPTEFPATSTPSTPAGKIRFKTGATSAYVQKIIAAGDEHQFLVRALKDQIMILTVSSPDNDVYLDVKGGEDGQRLLRASSEATYWSGRLPSSQEYEISLTTGSPNTYYFLSIEIPSSIYFDTGAYSDTLDGTINVHENFHPGVLTRVRYRARAFAGQVMTVELYSPNLDDLSMAISGEQDGQVYLRHEVKNSGGEITLPSDQAYYLDVYAVNGNSTSFTLQVTIK